MTVTSQAWLVIANEGGRWTCADVSKAIPEVEEKTLFSVIRKMAKDGYLKRYEKTTDIRRFRYGVTEACRIPVGIAPWEVVEAMGMRVRPELEEDPMPRNVTVGEVLRAFGSPDSRVERGLTMESQKTDLRVESGATHA